MITNKFQAFYFKIGVLLFSPILMTVFLLNFGVVWLVFGFIRYIISKVAQKLHPELGPMLTPDSCVMAADNIYSGTPPPCNIIASLQVKGDLNVEQCRKVTEERLINARCSKGKLIYPELTQNITSWIGYYFWKPVKSFKIENHVFVTEDFPTKCNGSFSQKEVEEYFSKLLRKPWSKEKPLWEIIIIKNYKPKNLSQLPDPEIPRSFVMLRMHHGLGDGLSAGALLFRIADFKFDLKQIKSPQKYKISKNFVQTLLRPIKLLIKAPYEFTYVMLTARDILPWDISTEQVQKADIMCKFVDVFPIAEFKRIRDKLGVGFNALVLSVIAGAYREMALKYYSEVPHQVGVALPVPLPGRTAKLTNRLGVVRVILPTGEPDAFKRLQIIQKNFNKTKHSSLLLMAAIAGNSGGRVPSFLMKWYRKNIAMTPSILLTNVPGTHEPTWFSGCPVEDVLGSLNYAVGTDFQMSLALCSNQGNMRFFLQGTTLLFQNKLHEMAELMNKHMEIYSKFHQLKIKESY